MKKYTAEYFIAKFEAIPEEKWTCGTPVRPDGSSCALGHCGVDNDYTNLTQEALALSELMRPVYNAYHGVEDEYRPRQLYHAYNINDNAELFGDSPKERVLNALTLIASGALKDV